METTTTSTGKTMVGIDQPVCDAIDRYREQTPSIKRSALVNQVLLEWLTARGLWQT